MLILVLAFPFSARRPGGNGGGGGGETATPGRDDNVTRCGAPSLHKTRETSVGLEELQHLFLQKRPLHIH